MARSEKTGKTRFEVLKADTGKFQWRLRAADGKVVQIKTGSVRLPKTTATQRKTANNAVQHALGIAADKQKA